jgi:predicted RNase H-like HicB family nuclease
MEITVELHVEPVEGGVSWWAESEQLPGVSAAGDSLSELREMLAEILDDLSEERGEPIVIVSEHLSDAVEDSETGSETQVRRVPALL